MSSGPRIYVLSADPGGTTGVAIVSVPRATIFGSAEYEGIEVHCYKQLTGPEPGQAEDVAWHWQALNLAHGQTPLVLERFSLRVMSRSPKLLSPVRITAMVKERVPMIGENGRHNIFLQDPGEAKKAAGLHRLKAWGIECPLIDGGDHARDALSHCVHFLRRAKINKSLREMAWGSGTSA